MDFVSRMKFASVATALGVLLMAGPSSCSIAGAMPEHHVDGELVRQQQLWLLIVVGLSYCTKYLSPFVPSNRLTTMPSTRKRVMSRRHQTCRCWKRICRRHRPCVGTRASLVSWRARRNQKARNKQRPLLFAFVAAPSVDAKSTLQEDSWCPEVSKNSFTVTVAVIITTSCKVPGQLTTLLLLCNGQGQCKKSSR